MENTYWFRWYLICSKIANCNMPGYEDQNFAKLHIQNGNGVYANSQMLQHFESANTAMSEIFCNEDDMVYEENDFETISKLTISELDKYFIDYCSRLQITEYKD